MLWVRTVSVSTPDVGPMMYGVRSKPGLEFCVRMDDLAQRDSGES